MVDVRDIDWENRERDVDLSSRGTLSDLEISIEDWDWELLVDAIVLLVSGLRQQEDLSTVYLLAREAGEQRSLIEEEHYASAVVRQSSFFDTLLYEDIQNVFKGMVERDLYNSEEGFIENLGHRSRVQLAHLLGILDQRERDILLNMAKWRNEVAHEWWFVAERVNEKQLRDVAVTVNELMWESIEEIVEESDDESVSELFENSTENQ